MQLAKNLWLTTDRSLLRKLKELLLARRLEEALPKKRILTLYLNVAEWGDGIYGIEAASRAHHGVSARQLTVAQGAILAAMLPSPRKWTPTRGPRVLRTRALRIIDQLKQHGRITADQAQLARDEVQTALAAPSEPATEPSDETSDDET
jgi:monofunctional biosynthetic peptidoglycan transglycosylase